MQQDALASQLVNDESNNNNSINKEVPEINNASNPNMLFDTNNYYQPAQSNQNNSSQLNTVTKYIKYIIDYFLILFLMKYKKFKIIISDSPARCTFN
jgi:hypothetical protein